MMFGKTRVIYIGTDTQTKEAFLDCLREYRSCFLAACYDDWNSAIEHVRQYGCDAIFSDSFSSTNMKAADTILKLDSEIAIGFFGAPTESLRNNICFFSRFNHEGALDSLLFRCPDTDALASQYGFYSIINAIDKTQDARSRYEALPESIKRHSERVAELTEGILRYASEHGLMSDSECAYELRPECLQYAYEAALLHDVGKAFLPDWLLEKHTAYTRQERALVSFHTQFGYRLLESFETPLMIDENLVGEPLRRYMAQECAGMHHELIDGNSWQVNYSPEDGSFNAKVCTVANAFDDLTNGLDGRVCGRAEAHDWIMARSGSWFTEDACEMFDAYWQAKMIKPITAE